MRLVNWAIQNGDADFGIARCLSPQLSESANSCTSTAFVDYDCSSNSEPLHKVKRLFIGTTPTAFRRNLSALACKIPPEGGTTYLDAV